MDVAGGWTFVRRNPSALLLAVQLLGVVLYPFVDAPGGRALLGLFGLLVLLLAVWTVRTTPALTWVAILLGIPVVCALVALARETWRRLGADRSGMYWIRGGAFCGLAAVAAQSLWETGLTMPANAALAALAAAIVVHDQAPEARH